MKLASINVRLHSKTLFMSKISAINDGINDGIKNGTGDT